MQSPDVQTPLRRGIRAARAGRPDRAAPLLEEAIRDDPQREEAWLWLSRVTPDSERKAEALQQALALNPDNRWAADQLDLLRAEAAPPPAPGERRVEALTCPNCAGTVETYAGDAAKAVVCQYCDSVLDLTQHQLAILGKTNRRYKPAFPFEPGMQATFEDEPFNVIGWIKYEGWDDEDRWEWDEWLMLSEAGTLRWLTFDRESGFSLLKREMVPEDLDLNHRTKISIPGGIARIVERAPAEMVAMDGELTWRATAGDRIRYIDAKAGATKYSVEYTDDEVELFSGYGLSRKEVFKAFGIEDKITSSAATRPAPAPPRPYSKIAFRMGLLGLLLTFVSFVFGSEIFSDSLQLTPSETAEVEVGSFEVTQATQPHYLSLQAETFAYNNWAAVETYIVDPSGNRYLLVNTTFWAETGQDSDGEWSERDLTESRVFRPDVTGTHLLYVAMPEASIPSLSVDIRLERGIWLTRYFVIYTVLCFFLAFMIRVRGG